MAAIKSPMPSSFTLKYIIGVEEGKVLYKTSTYNRVVPEALDDNVLDVALVLFGLSEYGIGSIIRTDKGEILEDN